MKIAYKIFGRFRIKIMLTFISAMAVVCTASGFFIYHYASGFVLERLRINLMEIAEIAVTRVEAAALLSVPLNPEGVNSLFYKSIEKELSLIQQVSPLVKYIYILKKGDSSAGILRFIIDADINRDPNDIPACPGDKYDASEFDELLRGFSEPSADRAITIDKWGAFLSGYAPIFDEHGKPFAVLGVDMLAHDVCNIQAGVRKYLIFSTVSGIMLSILFAFLVSAGISKKVRELEKGFSRAARGDLDYNIKIKGNDELSDLALFFNNMSSDLKRYIEELKATTSDKERLLSELNIAKNIQQSFLPDTMPQAPGIDISAMTIPARVVGGDFYDFIPIGENKWGIVIADVSGKGVPAALFVALSRALIRSNASLYRMPDLIVKNTNTKMIELSRSNMFETLFYGVLDVKDMIFCYANAGHNPPFILGNPYHGVSLLKAQTFPVGIMPDMEIELKSHHVKRGDTIILYTDGITEAMNTRHEEYGTRRLMDILRKHIDLSSSGLIEKIKQDIALFSGSAEQHDDMTMIVIRSL